METFFAAIYHLMFFKPYTTYPRWFEIGCGIYAWLNVSVIIYAVYNLTK
jgi:uncharacterized membrane protein YhdT